MSVETLSRTDYQTRLSPTAVESELEGEKCVFYVCFPGTR